MITRAKLVEQLREYQIRSQHKCSALTIFSPKPRIVSWQIIKLSLMSFLTVYFLTRIYFSFSNCDISFLSAFVIAKKYGEKERVAEDFVSATKTPWSDVTVAVLFAILFSILVVSSYVTLYFRHFWLSFFIICLGIFLPIRLRRSRQALTRKRERRMLLPLSM